MIVLAQPAVEDYLVPVDLEVRSCDLLPETLLVAVAGVRAFRPVKRLYQGRR
jgi:hypothetical protein